MDTLMGKAIASSPEGTLRARFSLRVVNTFFMRAANDALSYDHRFGAMRSQEVENLLPNNGIIAHV